MKEARQLTITIPGRIPPELNPNYQPKDGLGYWQKNSESRHYQYVAFIYACNARNLWERAYNEKWLPLEKAILQITVYYKANQKVLDDQNLIHSLKSAIDALCATKSGIGQGYRAEIIRDDSPSCLTILKPIWIKGEPKVVLELERRLE